MRRPAEVPQICEVDGCGRETYEADSVPDPAGDTDQAYRWKAL